MAKPIGNAPTAAASAGLVRSWSTRPSPDRGSKCHRPREGPAGQPVLK